MASAFDWFSNDEFGFFGWKIVSIINIFITFSTFNYSISITNVFSTFFLFCRSLYQPNTVQLLEKHDYCVTQTNIIIFSVQTKKSIFYVYYIHSSPLFLSFFCVVRCCANLWTLISINTATTNLLLIVTLLIRLKCIPQSVHPRIIILSSLKLNKTQ